MSDYEQLDLDTRPELDKALDDLAIDTIEAARGVIQRSGVAPSPVRNRHEAYGFAAEHLATINGKIKAIKRDTDDLLNVLDKPNRSAIEVVSSICNSTAEATATLIEASAAMRRILSDLYDAENRDIGPTPLELLAEDAGFQEVEPIDPDEENDTNTETETED